MLNARDRGSTSIPVDICPSFEHLGRSPQLPFKPQVTLSGPSLSYPSSQYAMATVPWKVPWKMPWELKQKMILLSPWIPSTCCWAWSLPLKEEQRELTAGELMEPSKKRLQPKGERYYLLLFEVTFSVVVSEWIEISLGTTWKLNSSPTFWLVALVILRAEWS